MANSRLIKYRDSKGNTYPYLYVDEMSGIFYIRFRTGQSLKTASLGTKNFNEARPRVLEKAIELKNTRVKETKKNLIFMDFYEKMIIEKKAKSVKESTLKRINVIWENSLEPFWSYILPEDINHEKITEFIYWHKRRRPGVQLVNVFKYLGNVINIMVRLGFIEPKDKPSLELPNDEVKHHAKQKGRYITDDEIKNIISHADKRTKLIILIAYSTGMRKMELGSLELSRLNKVKDYYVVNLDTDDTKTGISRQIPIPPKLTALIDEQINPKAKYLFPMVFNLNRHISGQIIDKGWVAAKEKAGITGQMRYHDIRHTAASNCAKKNINPIFAATLLGMSIKVYQRIYLKLSPQDLIIASTSLAESLGEI